MVEQDHAASKLSLVLADVDGTLVTADKVLTPRARAAVKAIHDAGIAFAITSGRPPRGMAMLIDPLALRTPIAGFNGGIFVKPDMTIMEEHVLAADVAQRALEVILRNGMDVWVYSGKDWLVRNRNAPHVAREQWTVKFAPAVTNNFDDAFATLLSRCHASGRQQGDRRHGAVEAPVDPGRRDRHHRGHAERRADVSQQRPQHRHGQCQPGRASSGRFGYGILRR